MNRTRLLTLIEIAILAAMAFVLGEFELFSLPQGGGVSLVMVPIAILSLRRGIVAGIIGGLIVGILKIIFGGWLVHPMQVILDYPLAFAFMGLAGMFVTRNKNASFALYVLGIVIAGVLKWFSHVLAGVFFFSEGIEGNPWVYSITYNSFVVVELTFATIAAAILYLRAKHLFQPTR